MHCLRRSVLYVPGSNPRALEKAATLDADVFVLDLEDSVAPEQKPAARVQVGRTIAGLRAMGRDVVVRVNALSTSWGADDVGEISALGPDALLIPKGSSPETILQVAALAEQAPWPEHMRLWAMVETPLAILNIESIARLALDPGSRLAALVVGTNDLAKETRVRQAPGRLPMLAWLSSIVAAARAYNVDLIDGVWNDFSDTQGFLDECQQGKDFGMDGKSLIHPIQIDIANRVFSPSQEEVESARRIVAAFALPENAGKGVISLDGGMVELLHAEMAQRTIAMHQAIERRRSV